MFVNIETPNHHEAFASSYLSKHASLLGQREVDLYQNELCNYAVKLLDLPIICTMYYVPIVNVKWRCRVPESHRNMDLTVRIANFTSFYVISEN